MSELIKKRKRIGVVQFPGSNCERETKLALERIGLEPMDCFWHADKNFLENLDGFIIVGGFSYEDRVRSGLIASKDSFMDFLKQEAQKGKPLLGICNGAQILVESGLLGGPVALCANQKIDPKSGQLLGTGFYNDWVEIQSNKKSNGFNKPLKLPIAHAEGRFILDPDFYQDLLKSGTTLYTYCGENPNGSMYNLAAVSHPLGHIMAMMPHPERTTEGDLILKIFFSQALKITQRLVFPAPVLKFLNTKNLNYLNKNTKNYYISLKIHDNEAISLSHVLKIKLKKLINFKISSPVDSNPLSEKDFAKILDSAELFNPQKEYLSPGPESQPELFHYVIKAKEDPIAQEKQIRLAKLLGKDIKIEREIIWSSPEKLSEKSAGMLGNPLSHEGFLIEPSKPKKSMIQGKVRDITDQGETLILQSTNRLSAFDRAICTIPYKGEVLNQLSAFWFAKTEFIIQNHLIKLLSPAAMQVKKCQVLPIEVVVRAYMTGSTNTSVWTLYQQGERVFFNTQLPDGLVKNQKLPQVILTPTSKSQDHDRPLSPQGLLNIPGLNKTLWTEIEQKALQLFNFASDYLSHKNLILVDTKYEFGLDPNGKLCLIDEIHTPDSSRYWDFSDWQEALKTNTEPRSYDKEIIRLWYKNHCNPYEIKNLPEAPKELIQDLSHRYQTLYEKITGECLTCAESLE